MRGFAAEVTGEGPHALEVSDLRGRTLAVLRGRGPRSHDLSSAVERNAGVYLLRLTTSKSSLIRRLPLGR